MAYKPGMKRCHLMIPIEASRNITSSSNRLGSASCLRRICGDQARRSSALHVHHWRPKFAGDVWWRRSIGERDLSVFLEIIILMKDDTDENLFYWRKYS